MFITNTYRLILNTVNINIILVTLPQENCSHLCTLEKRKKPPVQKLKMLRQLQTPLLIHSIFPSIKKTPIKKSFKRGSYMNIFLIRATFHKNQLEKLDLLRTFYHFKRTNGDFDEDRRSAFFHIYLFLNTCHFSSHNYSYYPLFGNFLNYLRHFRNHNFQQPFHSHWFLLLDNNFHYEQQCDSHFSLPLDRYFSQFLLLYGFVPHVLLDEHVHPHLDRNDDSDYSHIYLGSFGLPPFQCIIYFMKRRRFVLYK